MALAREAQAAGKKVVFTNGCFDLLHAGHVDLLNRARSLGDLLIRGLSTDAGVRAQNKGPERPIVPQDQRAAVVAGLQAVDLVRAAQASGKKVVFTNGCFDLLHAGHVDLLNRARSLGDLLVLGLN
ncbi:MAG: adenylyltransferase/cytidyltransferase family protein, partial [Proteobacteria bacterium]|nr:adenylyltransferase/cytidyltransferase family protein [Pseudomonadota bacterium]